MPHTESLSQKIIRRIRRLLPARAFRAVQHRLRGRRGIEIGGPSAVFRRWNLWPLYPVLQSVDQYNFAATTIWSESEGGQPLIGEATTMTGVNPGSYDILLASHVLEHLANPLKALHAWRRVVVPGGTLVLVVPHRDGTFDHRRPITSLEHLRRDYELDTGEDDTTHVPEILELHDLDRDPGAGSRANFLDRALKNTQYRSLHHHVFTTESLLRLVNDAGLRILYVDVERPYHICVVCTPDEKVVGNEAYWSADAPWRSRKLFPSDRVSPVEGA